MLVIVISIQQLNPLFLNEKKDNIIYMICLPLDVQQFSEKTDWKIFPKISRQLSS